MDLKDDIALVAKKLLFEQPYYGLYLMMLNKESSYRLSTAGVSKQGLSYKLTVNPDFWNSLSQSEKIGILHHEVLHIVFFHPLTVESYPDKLLFNIAADMEINQYIPDERLPGKSLTKEEFDEKYGPIIKELNVKYLSKEITKEEYKKALYGIPSRGVYIEDFKDLKLDKKAGTRYYYDKLSKASGKNKTLKALLSAMKEGLEMIPEGMVPNHDTWDDFKDISEAEAKLIRSQVDYQLKEIAEQVSKTRGLIPAELAEYIKLLYEIPVPKFDWKGYLRRFVDGTGQIFTKKMRRKINKRFEENPGIKVKRKKHVLVGVDTSGSVSNDELEEFFQEIYHMRKTGAMVTVIQCDAAISNIATYKGAKDIKIHGRGGTSFQPVIDYYNQNIRKFTCLIYLTDGEAPAPTDTRGKLLWVLSSKSKKTDHLPGRTIKLN